MKWRLAVALAWGSLFVASLYDYNGKWRIIPLRVAAVGGFVAVVDNRRNRKTDDLTTLNFQCEGGLLAASNYLRATAGGPSGEGCPP